MSIGSFCGKVIRDDRVRVLAGTGACRYNRPKVINMGLRDRKKLKTRLAVQQEAMRLFREQGYRETTVDQIAAAVEISPSTFFRYFPTKESVVLADFYDPLMADIFLAQPNDLSVFEALRETLKGFSARLSGEANDAEAERVRLIMTVPEVLAAFWQKAVETSQQSLVEALARRTGLDQNDRQIRMYANVIFGLGIAVTNQWMAHPEEEWIHLFDEAIQCLVNGFQ